LPDADSCFSFTSFTSYISLTFKRRAEFAGGQIIHGAQAPAQFGVAQSPPAEQPRQILRRRLLSFL
jgi:hypothetical protein